MPPLHQEGIIVMRQSQTSIAAAEKECRHQSRGDGSSDTESTSSTTPAGAPSVYTTQRGKKKKSQRKLQAKKVPDITDQNVLDETDTISVIPTETTPLNSGTLFGVVSQTNNLSAVVAAATSTSSKPVPSLSTNGKIVLRWWICGMLLPIGTLSWLLTGQVLAAIGAMLFMPMLAILQGSVAIIRYRIKFRNCPLPKAPSHGIVRVQDSSAVASASRMENVVDDYSSKEERDGPEADNAPLRLLVIGDSLAVGVGQSSSSTPVMPETIAKSLSKELGGRPVLWTCHGAPGASAGWIVRELERSIKEGKFQHSSSSSVNDDFEAPSMSSLNLKMETTYASSTSGLVGRTTSTVSESDSTVDDDSSDSDSDVGEERRTWQERLHEERVHFDPHRVGPFDIAVVLTGSNDLKSAFFPFLLTGEDAKFRKEAQERGGGYGRELTRILQVLNNGMRLQLQTLRDSVEGATQKVRERLGSLDSVPQKHSTSFSRRHDGGGYSRTSEDFADAIGQSASASLFPMVVLPGMPARALPIFSTAPLRWLAVPIVDIMDSHKRQLARRHRGEVLFVDAPTPEQISEYVDEEGEYRRQEKQDNILLRLRDIKTRHAKRIESDMKSYFGSDMAQPRAKLGQRNRHHSVFSVDGIHPNDIGYMFWGRHIAHHIVQEWQQKKQVGGVIQEGCL